MIIPFRSLILLQFYSFAKAMLLLLLLLYHAHKFYLHFMIYIGIGILHTRSAYISRCSSVKIYIFT